MSLQILLYKILRLFVLHLVGLLVYYMTMNLTIYVRGVRFLKLIGSASTTEGYPSGSGIGPDGIRIKGGKIIGLEITVWSRQI